MPLDQNGQPTGSDLDNLVDVNPQAPADFTEGTLGGGPTHKAVLDSAMKSVLGNRGAMNLKEGFRDSAVGAADTAGTKLEATLPAAPPDTPKEILDFARGRPFVYGGKMMIDNADQQEYDRQKLLDIDAAKAAYEASSGGVGIGEKTAAIGGWLLGAAASPENLAFPEIKGAAAVFSPAWRAAHPIIESMITYGAGQALVQATADPVKQAAEITAGLRKEYSPLQTVEAVPLGFAMGAAPMALHGLGSIIYRNSLDALATRFAGERPKLNPEFMPERPPAPEINPRDPSAGHTVPTSIPAGVELPPVAEGHVRLYRADAPGVAPTSPGARIEFTTDATRAMETPGWGARPNERTQISYIDMPSDSIAGRMSGDRVALNGDEAAARQAIPEAPSGQAAAPRTGTVAAEAVSPKITTEPVSTQDGSGFRAVVDGRTVLNERRAAITYKTEAAARSAAEKSIIKSAPVKASDEQLKTLSSKELQDIAIKQGTPVDNVFTLDGMKPLPKDALIAEIRARQPKTEPVKPAEAAKVPEAEPVDLPEGASKNWRAAMEDATKTPDELAALTEKEIARIDKQIDAAEKAGADGKVAELIAVRDAVEEASTLVQRQLADARTRAIAEHPNALVPLNSMQNVVPSNVHPAQLPLLQRLSNTIKLVADELGVQIRVGHMKAGNVAEFDPVTKVVRLKDATPNSFIAFAHEIGHLVQDKVGAPLRAVIAAHDKTVRNFSPSTALGDPAPAIREGFGEFMTAFVSRRTLLENRYPNFLRDFIDVMQQKAPELLKTLEGMRSAWETHQNAPTPAGAATISHAQIPKAEEANPLKLGLVGRWFNKIQREISDEQQALHDAFQYLAQSYLAKRGKLLDISTSEDFRVLAQVFREGGSQMAFTHWNSGVINYHTHLPEGPAPSSVLTRVATIPGERKPTKDGAVLKRRLQDFDDYLAMLHASDLHAAMANGSSPLTRNPTKFSEGEVKEKVRYLEATYPEFIPLASEIHSFTAHLNQRRFDAGILSAEDLAAYQQYPRYVPLRRDMNDLASAMASGSTAKDKGFIEEFMLNGSDRDVLSPMESLLFKAHAIEHEIAKTRSVNALDDLIKLVGGPEGAAIGVRIPAHELRSTAVDIEEAVLNAARKSGWTKQDAKDLAHTIVQTITPNNNDTLFGQIFRANVIETGSKPVLYGKRNGEIYALELPSTDFGRHMKEAFDSIGPDGPRVIASSLGITLNILTSSGAGLRAGITTPTYSIKNTIRDQLAAWLQIPEAGTMKTFSGYNFVRGAISLARKDEFWRMHVQMGGVEGGMNTAVRTKSVGADVMLQDAGINARSVRGAERENAITAAHDQAVREGKTAAEIKMAEDLAVQGMPRAKMLRFDSVLSLMKMAEWSESAGRIGLFRSVYDANIKMGRSHEYALFDAAQKARDILDYGKHGSRMEITTKIVPFLNSNLRGMAKAADTVAKILPYGKAPLTEAEADYQHAMRVQLTARATGLAAISAAIAATYADDPLYQSISPQARATYWIIPMPFLKSGKYTMLGGSEVELPEGMLGAWAFIPKPWELGTIFNLAERVTEFTVNSDPEALNRFAGSLKYTLTPPTPLDFPIVKVESGLKANYDDYFQRPIIPERLQGISPHLQSTEYTQKMYVALASALNGIWKSDDAHSALRKIPMIGAMLAAPWSPVESQYLMQGMFADWPREIGGVIGLMHSLSTGNPVNVQDIPVLRALIRERLGSGQTATAIYADLGAKDGRMTVALNTFNKYNKEMNDPKAADIAYGAMDQDQRDYVGLHTAASQARGYTQLATALHPVERAKNLMAAVGDIKRGLALEEGLPSFSDSRQRTKLDPGARKLFVEVMDEMVTKEAFNSLNVHGAPGYVGREISDTKPYFDVMEKISPEATRELGIRLADKKVYPLDTIERLWPEAQKAVRIGGDTPAIGGQLRELASRAATNGFLGGGVRLGRSSLDSAGAKITRAKAPAVTLPSSGGLK